MGFKFRKDIWQELHQLQSIFKLVSENNSLKSMLQLVPYVDSIDDVARNLFCNVDFTHKQQRV